eukprot:3407372-Prymnesium_polylepis.1
MFDRSGQLLITGSDDANVKVWSVDSGLLQYTLRGHTAEITELAIAPANHLLVSASNDGTARVWRLHEGTPEAVLAAHNHSVNSVCFSRSLASPWLLSIGHDASVLLWNSADWAAPPLRLRAAPDGAPSAGFPSAEAGSISANCCAISPTG